jgi:hypothetical protein
MPIPSRFAVKPPDESEIAELCALCDEIEDCVLQKGDPAALLTRWNARANRPFASIEFKTYSGAMDQRAFVTSALIPRAEQVPDLQYSELLEVIQSVIEGDVDEAELGHFLGWLEAQFPGSSVSDLIYWPDQWFGSKEALAYEFTTAQIARALMDCSGRVLPAAPAVSLPFEVPKKKPAIALK